MPVTGAETPARGKTHLSGSSTLRMPTRIPPKPSGLTTSRKASTFEARGNKILVKTSDPRFPLRSRFRRAGQATRTAKRWAWTSKTKRPRNIKQNFGCQPSFSRRSPANGKLRPGNVRRWRGATTPRLLSIKPVLTSIVLSHGVRGSDPRPHRILPSSRPATLLACSGTGRTRCR